MNFVCNLTKPLSHHASLRPGHHHPPCTLMATTDWKASASPPRRVDLEMPISPPTHMVSWEWFSIQVHPYLQITYYASRVKNTRCKLRREPIFIHHGQICSSGSAEGLGVVNFVICRYLRPHTWFLGNGLGTGCIRSRTSPITQAAPQILALDRGASLSSLNGSRRKWQ